VKIGIGFTFILALAGIASRAVIMVSGLARPLSNNIFFRLYAMHELPFLLLLAATSIIVMVVLRLATPDAALDGDLDVMRLPRSEGGPTWLLATVVVMVTLAATHVMMHRLLFSMDEFSADFQARLFAGGRLATLVPAVWRPFAPLITPVFVAYLPSGSWMSIYLPMYALIKAPFVAIGLGELLNPLLAGLAIIAMAGIGRRLWPAERLRPWLAIALLASSSEFLITSASGYTMPAHLALNLVWLWLYLRDDNRSWAAALGVGVVAMGLHQPFPHALFVAPFLIRLVRDRRWNRAGSAAAVYGVASVVWFLWIRAAQPVAQAGQGGLSSVFALPDARGIWLQVVNLALLFTWQAPVAALLVAAALASRRARSPVLNDAALGVALTLGFYFFFPATQGHGWGYRYAYQVLGNLALLGAAGIAPLRDALGARRALQVAWAGIVAALVIQLPVRVVETERFVRPFAAAQAYVRSRPADVVVLHTDSVWYGRDLVRNDPFLRGQPVVVGTGMLQLSDREALRQALPGRVIDVTDAELLALGMTRWTHRVR
jgi:hypothetical protein